MTNHTENDNVHNNNNNNNDDNNNNSTTPQQQLQQSQPPTARIRLPHIERGIFHYRIIATTPIPILTGPDVNAPPTKAFLLPGTIQEISVRVRYSQENHHMYHTPGNISFLRLSYRRGWIADRKIIPTTTASTHATTTSSIILVQEVITNDTESHCSSSRGGSNGRTSGGSVHSGTISSSLLTNAAATESTSLLSIATTKRPHRHRPPRKRQDAATTTISSKTSFSSNRTMDSDKMMILPRHIMDTKSFKKVVVTNDPSSNMSILSDDSSHATHLTQATTTTSTMKLATQSSSAPASPNVSLSTNTSIDNRNGSIGTTGSTTTRSTATYFLMRVLAPKGMKILDAPQFQVNRLIRHGKSNSAQSGSHTAASSSHLVSQMAPISRTHNSIFQTMSSRLTNTGKSPANGNVPIFDHNSKTRILPCGALFESSKRMETTGSYNQGAGLIKLSDQSGWAVVPRQSELEQQYLSNNHTGAMNGYTPTVPNRVDDANLKSYEEVGSAVVDVENHLVSSLFERRTEWVRVLSRAGITVSCPPPLSPPFDNDSDNVTSPASSRESSAIASSNNLNGSSSNNQNHLYPSNDSDVASSVGSAFLDALFRTPQKKKAGNGKDPNTSHRMRIEKLEVLKSTIPCGMFLEVERSDDASRNGRKEFARLCGGQGWIPLTITDKPTTATIPCQPVFRYGSIWFRVQATRGIKVRYGPSNRASSIKSEDGEYFRFECGEFLRASETITSFSENGEPNESFAKLYRNRHVQLHSTYDNFRSLQSLTIEAEWVQIHNETDLFLEECMTEPRMERHKQGWRYNVVPDNGIAIRKGPSFAAERTGVLLFGGESVVINERVTPAGDQMSWLRLKDGQGWIHDYDENGEQVVVAHSLRHRAVASRTSPRKTEASEVAYNKIISRLFHNDGSERPTER